MTLFLFLAFWTPAYAVIDKLAEYAAAIVGFLLQLYIKAIGAIFILIAHTLINWIAPYNNFIKSTTVSEGWVIVRDLANMFFIMVLLVIAFGTMLGKKEYHYTALLPRLLVMAVLINFSKTIVGLIIDAGQVVMLTFVNAFQAAAGGNLATGLGIPAFFTIDKHIDQVGAASAVGGFILAAIMLTIALITVLIMTMTLAWRIVQLWVLTIISPIAFFLSTFPRGKKYYDQWWDQLICWVGSGPVLAFFLWLAFATMVQAGAEVAATHPGEAIREGPQLETGPSDVGIPTEAASETNMVKFIIGIALLLAGLEVGKQFCAVGGGLASWAGSKAKGYAMAGAKGAAKLGAAGAWYATKGAAARADYAVKRRTGRSVRERAYGAMGAVGFKRFATERMGKAQEKQSEAYKKHSVSAKAAASASPKDFRRTLRGVVVPTPAGHAQRAARLNAALTDKGMQKELTKDEQQKYYQENQDIAKQSGNPDVVKEFGEMQKKMPHLVPETVTEAEKAKGFKTRAEVAQKTSGAQALELPKEALEDVVIASNLSAGVVDHVNKRGTKEQKEALERGLKGEGARPDNISDPTARRENVQARTPENLAALSPEVNAKVFEDMKPEQKEEMLKRDQVKVDAIPKEHLTADDGAHAADLARYGSPEQRRKVVEDPERADAYRAGLSDHLAKNPTMPKEEQFQIKASLLLAGEDVDKVFPNKDELGEAAKGPQARAVLEGLRPSDLDRPETRDAVVENVDVTVLSQMASGSRDEQVNARVIAKAIQDGGGTRARDINMDPTLKALLERGVKVETPPPPAEEGGGGPRIVMP